MNLFWLLIVWQLDERQPYFNSEFQALYHALHLDSHHRCMPRAPPTVVWGNDVPSLYFQSGEKRTSAFLSITLRSTLLE